MANIAIREIVTIVLEPSRCVTSLEVSRTVRIGMSTFKPSIGIALIRADSYCKATRCLNAHFLQKLIIECCGCRSFVAVSTMRAMARKIAGIVCVSDHCLSSHIRRSICICFLARSSKHEELSKR